jgi:hypothetical protein
LGYVFATHDIHLVEWLRPEKIIHVRDSLLVSEHPEQRRFDLSVLTTDDGLPEELRYAILGSRRKLLFVEGTATSEDQALYRQLYAGWNIVPHQGWETVSHAVRSLAGNDQFHWLAVAGLIDGDGRDESERDSLAAERVFSLPVPSIENLFLNPTVLRPMATAAHALYGGETAQQRMTAMEARLAALLVTSKDDILARRLAWAANRLISAQKLSVAALREGQFEIPRIDLQIIRQRIDGEFDRVLATGDYGRMLSEIPLKNTSVPSRVVELIGFSSFKKYKQALLMQVEAKSEAGREIVSVLRGILPNLDMCP